MRKVIYNKCCMHYLSPRFLFTHHIQRGQSDEIISKIVLIGQEGGIGFIRLFENCQVLKKTLFYFFCNHDYTQNERNLRYDLDMAIVFYNAFW